MVAYLGYEKLKAHAAARYSGELSTGCGIIAKGDAIGVVVIVIIFVLAIILIFLHHRHHHLRAILLPAAHSQLSS